MMIEKFPEYLFGAVLFLMVSSSVSAQSVTGKWNQITARQYPVESGTTTPAKPYIETDMSTIGMVIYEFKSDNSYIMTSASPLDSENKRTGTGSWSQAGDVLTMSTLTGGQSVRSKVSFESGNLVLETLHPESKRIRKVVLIFKKL